VYYGTSLTCVTLSVQSDLILSELQPHLERRWTAFWQYIWWADRLFAHFEHYCYMS